MQSLSSTISNSLLYIIDFLVVGFDPWLKCRMIYEYGTTFKYLLWNYFYLELSYFSGFPVVNDPLYNHVVFGPEKGKGGRIGKSDEKLIEVQM